MFRKNPVCRGSVPWEIHFSKRAILEELISNISLLLMIYCSDRQTMFSKQMSGGECLTLHIWLIPLKVFLLRTSVHLWCLNTTLQYFTGNLCIFSQVCLSVLFPTLLLTLHYTTLQYTTLHYNTLHYTGRGTSGFHRMSRVPDSQSPRFPLLLLGHSDPGSQRPWVTAIRLLSQFSV